MDAQLRTLCLATVSILVGRISSVGPLTHLADAARETLLHATKGATLFGFLGFSVDRIVPTATGF
jgi:hypothetical protein